MTPVIFSVSGFGGCRLHAYSICGKSFSCPFVIGTLFCMSVEGDHCRNEPNLFNLPSSVPLGGP